MSALIEETKCLLPRVAFIACGSFSPPTPMHLRMFEIARDHFEMTGSHKVVGGIISPTHDSYGKKGLISSLHRCAMLRIALQSSNWIRLSDWEACQTQWSRTKSVLQYHQNFINNYINSPDIDELNGNLPDWLPLDLRQRHDPVQLRLLCGADLLESFAISNLWSDEDIEDIVAHYGLVVISRFGSNPEKFIFESDVLTKYQCNITLITNWVPNEVSSSMVRRLLNRGQSVKYLLDDKVLEYIRIKCLFNYKAEYITDSVRPNQFALHQHSFKLPNTKTNFSELSPNSVNSDTEDELSAGSLTGKHMNESDSDFKQNVVNNMMHVDTRRAASVLCCGENEQPQSKVIKLHMNRNGPGQAVQVIVKELKGQFAKQLTDNVERTPKMFKTSKMEDV